MSTTAESPARLRRHARRIDAVDPASVDLTPLSARDAVGRSTGIQSVPSASPRVPLWQSAGIVGLIAIIAAAALPLLAGALAIPV